MSASESKGKLISERPQQAGVLTTDLPQPTIDSRVAHGKSFGAIQTLVLPRVLAGSWCPWRIAAVSDRRSSAGAYPGTD